MGAALAVDLALACLLLELAAMALTAWRRPGARGALRALLPGTGAGLALLIGLRLAVSDGPAPLPVLAALALGGLAHALDLWQRWPRSDRPAAAAPATVTPPRA